MCSVSEITEERAVSRVHDTWQVPGKWSMWHGSDIQANHLPPASNRAIWGTHQTHSPGERDELRKQRTSPCSREGLNGRTEWVSWGRLVSKLIASFQQGSGLITMNLIPKLAARLRCQGQEPTSCGAQPGISVSLEVLLIGALEITQQQLPAAGNSKSCCRNRYTCRFSLKSTYLHSFCELLSTEE